MTTQQKFQSLPPRIQTLLAIHWIQQRIQQQLSDPNNLTNILLPTLLKSIKEYALTGKTPDNLSIYFSTYTPETQLYQLLHKLHQYATKNKTLNLQELQTLKPYFGNSIKQAFKKINLPQKYKTTHTITIAQKIWEDQHTNNMPILADALEDAKVPTKLVQHMRENNSTLADWFLWQINLNPLTT